MVACWKTGWFKYFKNHWFPKIFMCSSLESFHWMVRKTEKHPWVAFLCVETPCWWKNSVENYSNSNSLLTAQVSITISQNAQHFEPWGGWATKTGDHIEFLSCQPRTGLWGYHGHNVTETVQLIRKTSPGLFPIFIFPGLACCVPWDAFSAPYSWAKSKK